MHRTLVGFAVRLAVVALTRPGLAPTSSVSSPAQMIAWLWLAGSFCIQQHPRALALMILAVTRVMHETFPAWLCSIPCNAYPPSPLVLRLITAHACLLDVLVVSADCYR